MKLRNKKTGVVGEVGYISTSTGDILVSNIHDQEEWYHYKSLAGLNAEWEDVTEEPKTFFTIYYDGTISEFKDGDDGQIRDMKAIGNYFETREEAEKTVEKLKALKRLKDKGFRLEGHSMLNYAPNDTYDYSPSIGFSIPELDKDEPYEYPEEIEKDLDICFGGEE